jgi:hypothetical protein
MFVNVCYFLAAEIVLLEPRDMGGGGRGGEGDWTSFTVYFLLSRVRPRSRFGSEN